MKNSKLIFLLVGILLILPACLIAQDQLPQAPGLFQKIGDWIKSNALEMGIVMAGTLGAKYGITQFLKKLARKGVGLFHSIETTASSLEELCQSVDNAIKEDGTIEQNSLKDVIASGKAVKTSVGDMIVEFKPK